MKRMKGIVSFMLAMIMVFAMSVSAMAEEPGTTTYEGSVTINNTTSGKFYELYRIFDLTYKTDAEDNATTIASYTIAEKWTGFFGENGAGNAYLVDTNPLENLNAITVDGTTKYISITDGNVGTFAQDALEYVGSTGLEADKTTTATGNITTVNELPLGYYLVYPQGATDITLGNASICSLTSTTPSAVVTIKATYPTIQKTDSAQSADIGQTVNYMIEGTVPDTTGYASYTYTISDEMSSGLTYNSNSLNVYIGDVEVEEDDKTLKNQGTAIQIVKDGDDMSDDGLEVIIDNNSNSNTFTLTIPVAAMQDKYKGKKITVLYNATVNENAVNYDDGNVVEKNKATLTYSNDPKKEGSTETTAQDIEKVYSAKIAIDKVDGSDSTGNTKLAGAEFVLSKVEGTDIKYYQYKLATEGTTDTDTVEWVDNVEYATKLTTNDSGIGKVTLEDGETTLEAFIGLADGTYKLIEIKAPDGYNLLDEPKEITIDGDALKNGEGDGATTTPVNLSADDVSGSAPAENEGVLSITETVTNTSGSILPETGGIGTTIFYILGGVLVIGGGVVLVTKKRMGKEE